MANKAIVGGLAALAFCCWAVSLGGLAATQASCEDVTFNVYGFNAELPCYRIFRNFWWIISLEFVVIFALGCALMVDAFKETRFSFLGMFVIATVLYMGITDTTNNLYNATGSASDTVKARVDTLFAGTIMVSAVNCLVVMALGMVVEEDHHPKSEHSGEKATPV